MKKLSFILLLSLLITSNIFLFSQESLQSSPLEPGKPKHPVSIGILTGINYPLAPAIMLDKPATASKEVQKSLLNGLDGLGYGLTYNFGIIFKYPISEKMLIGNNIEYSSWKSKNSCNCDDVDFGFSENALSILHFGIFSHYLINENLYAGPELSLNLFDVQVTENSNRGKLDFTKNYPRIGLGLTVGYEIPLSKLFTLDISSKLQFPNILLGAENKSTGIESESLINSINETTEAKLFLFYLNIGILYSL